MCSLDNIHWIDGDIDIHNICRRPLHVPVSNTSNTLIEQGKCLGERWRMVVPPQLAYGDQGTGDIIPPAATLTFEVRLVQINQDWWQPDTAEDTKPGVNISR